jgi:hypothetical protein
MIRATAHVGSWISLSSLAGQVIAVDISCWLYLCLCISSAVWAGAGGDFSSTVSLVMERVEALARAGITPLLVFDGQPLPGKEGEAAERATARDASKQALLDHLAADGTYADENGRRLGRAMARRTPELTTQLMRKLRRHGYNFLVAAYEADMQVVYLERVGIVDAGLTGDGDLQMLGLHTVLYDAPGHRLDWGEGMVFRVARKDLRVAQADVDSDCSYSPSGDEAGSSDGWETVSCSSDSSSSSYSGRRKQDQTLFGRRRQRCRRQRWGPLLLRLRPRPLPLLPPPNRLTVVSHERANAGNRKYKVDHLCRHNFAKKPATLFDATYPTLNVNSHTRDAP